MNDPDPLATSLRAEANRANENLTRLLNAAVSATSTRAKAHVLLELTRTADRLRKLNGKLYRL